MSGVSERSRELVISTGQDASGAVLVTVQDSGPGLNPESVDSVFDAFYTTKPQGMGMGLSQSAVRSSTLTGDGYGPLELPVRAQLFSSPYPCPAHRTPDRHRALGESTSSMLL